MFGLPKGNSSRSTWQWTQWPRAGQLDNVFFWLRSSPYRWSGYYKKHQHRPDFWSTHLYAGFRLCSHPHPLTSFLLPSGVNNMSKQIHHLIGWRENLNRKPLFSPWNIGISYKQSRKLVTSPLNQTYGTSAYRLYSTSSPWNRTLPTHPHLTNLYEACFHETNLYMKFIYYLYQIYLHQTYLYQTDPDQTCLHQTNLCESHLYQTYPGWWFQPLWKIWKSVGMMTFPTEWKVIKFHGSKAPTSTSIILYQSRLYQTHLHESRLLWIFFVESCSPRYPKVHTPHRKQRAVSLFFHSGILIFLGVNGSNFCC